MNHEVCMTTALLRWWLEVVEVSWHPDVEVFNQAILSLTPKAKENWKPEALQVDVGNGGAPGVRECLSLTDKNKNLMVAAVKQQG